MQKLRLMVARGIVNLVNDAGGLQQLQVGALEDEVGDEVERVQNFGQTSHPPRGSVPVMVAVAGSRDHLVAVAVDDEASRPRNLQPGESATYNAHGVLFLFDQNGNATLTCKNFTVNASEGVQVNTPLATFSQAATVNGLFSYKAGMSGTGGGAGTQISGDITHTDGSLSSNGVTVHTHNHGGVTRGGDNTDGPR
ncbi:phage baseplate assembly protein V [Pseudogulbenkiania ferrooxidans]|uniref:Phage baseplate assembly protein V n=1 Tax=Pseudogulbenkiania ferrooxidans 2002 TaxID=279714 RepID=B9Z4Z0_9NEIS|nr:phage baseplate assembly protein V [Pseudogulbenkiania ferrooxidans]EEG08222.1 phage baseplate assembly protein V [Pseudogulbenkiania ferrooxidans 2002]